MGAIPGIRLVGLTGGAGSGKSYVANRMRAAGVTVFDLDVIGREIIDEDESVRDQIVKLCGSRVISQGRLDRRRLREIVFSDGAKRRDLESLLHPLIWQRFLEKCRISGKRFIVCEAALLVESKFIGYLDELVVVVAGEGLRKQRLIRRDQTSAALAERMIRSQASDDDKQQLATAVITNDGSFEDLDSQIDQLVETWKKIYF